jgi:hypothetical protein
MTHLYSRLAGGSEGAICWGMGVESLTFLGESGWALFTRNRQSLFCGGLLLTNASLILLALTL